MTQAGVYEQRVSDFRKLMKERDLSRVLVDGPEVVAYLTGYTPPTAMYQGAVLSDSNGPVLVVRGNNRARAESQTVCEQVLSYRDWDDPMDVLAKTLRETGSGPVGKDMTSMVMTSQRIQKLDALDSGIEFVDISPDIASIRAVKSSEEINLHRKAAGIADEATEVGLASLRDGKTVAEASIDAHTTARLRGADDRRTVVAKSENTDPLTPGPPVVMIELVPALGGYDTRSIRSVALGEASQAQLDNARKVVEIQDRQIESMKPGALARDIDAVCREWMLAEGLRSSYDGLTGHGVGFSWAGNTTDTTHAFTPAAEWSLRPGMVFHMYTRARGFVIGDTVLVTDDGPERLTTLERCLLPGSNRSER